jgi:8-oxo-dGTP pyrophosphatase MutT (NUDIX family)
VSAARLFDVAEVDLPFFGGGWRFAETEAERIAERWRARLAAQPRLYNGRVLMLGAHAIETRADGARVLTGGCFETDYASFIAWRDFGFPDREAFNVFAMAALVGADGGFLLGEMATHTFNAGAIYFPAGTPGPEDVFDGRLDLTASAMRELGEETGVAANEVAFASTWTVVYAPPRIACMKVMRLAEPAEAAKARIEAFLAADRDAELAAIHVARRLEEVDERRTPPFVVDFLRFAFAQRPLG